MLFPLFLVAVMSAGQPPTPPTPPTPQNEADESSVSVSASSQHDSQALALEMTGPVGVHPDRDPYLTLGAGARVEITERRNGDSKRLLLTPDVTVFSINGVESEFDAEARLWLRDVLDAAPDTPAPPDTPR